MKMFKYGFMLLTINLWLFFSNLLYGAEEIQEIIKYQWAVQLNDEEIKLYPYSALITFEALPELGKTTTVNLKLQAHQFCYQMPVISILRTYHKGEQFGAFDCSEIGPGWNPPIKKDDIYEGKFSFKAEKPGDYIIGIKVNTSSACTEKTESVFHIFFSFDETGKLVSLQGRKSIPENNAIILRFEQGQITNRFRINPPLSLNDTSQVLYKIIIEDKITKDLKISVIGSDGLDIIELPDRASDTIGSVYHYKSYFQIIPTEIGDGYFILQVEEVPELDKISFGKKDFKVIFNLDEQGKLESIDKEIPQKKIEE
jgi:hypothetical protein